MARSFGSIKPSICLSKRLSYLRSSSIVSATNINTTQLTNRKKIEACLTPTKAKIGDDMPDTELSNIDGNHHRLSDYKGKYLLLDFWSRSCGHCIESLPEMEILSDMWKEKVTFIGINIDDEKSWKEFSQRKNIKWIDLNDPKGAFGLYIRYKANGTPFYVLVTPDGKITDIWYGYNKDSLSERLKQGIK
ncbi:TlpA family protein disulfide reductase [Bacteroides fragilis]